MAQKVARCVDVGNGAAASSAVRGVGQAVAATLWVDAAMHAAECARFASYVMQGPEAHDCSLWVGAIGALTVASIDDGIGGNSLARTPQ